jgi:hypothetical protein
VKGLAGSLLWALLCCRSACAQAPADAALRLSALDAVGRAIANEKCQRPSEVKTQFVVQPLTPNATDEMQSHMCRGFRVAVYRSALGDSAREFPMSVVVEAAHPLLPSEWSIGATAAGVRARLGVPYRAAGESFSYSLRSQQPGSDVLTFETEAGIVRAVVWSWEID